MGYIHKTRFLQSTNSFRRSWWLWDFRLSHLHWTTQHHHSPTTGFGNIKKWTQPRFWHRHSVSISSQIPLDHSIYIPNCIDHSSNWRSFGNFWTRTHSETHFETYPPYLSEILEASIAPGLATISSFSQRPSTPFLDSILWSRILDLRHLAKRKCHKRRSLIRLAETELSFRWVAGAKLRTPKQPVFVRFCLVAVCRFCVLIAVAFSELIRKLLTVHTLGRFPQSCHGFPILSTTATAPTWSDWTPTCQSPSCVLKNFEQFQNLQPRGQIESTWTRSATTRTLIDIRNFGWHISPNGNFWSTTADVREQNQGLLGQNGREGTML